MPQVLLHAASGRKQPDLDDIAERLAPGAGEVGSGIAEVTPEFLGIKVQPIDDF